MKIQKNLLLGLLILLAIPVQASELSETLFANNRVSVFQIWLIDTRTSQRSALGSGFRVGPDGIVATNYHVVSDAVYEKTAYRIEAVDDHKTHFLMKLVAVDVIHDLALLVFNSESGPYLPLPITLRKLSQGEAVFSLGNPLDLGMMVVEGQYNGLVNDARFEQMIFSGNINSGMSGGPAIDRNGDLVGINVASSGDGIGYLVHAKFLHELLLDLPAQQSRNLVEVVGKQLLAEQEKFFAPLISQPWTTQDFFELTVPDKLHISVKCWGESSEEKDRRYDDSTMRCDHDDTIYVRDGRRLGALEYSYMWTQALDLNRTQLYSAVEDTNDFGSQSFSRLDRGWTKDEVTEFACNTAFVNNDSGRWRLVHCVRAYKQFSGLFDVGLLMTSVDHNDKNISAEIAASGISHDNARRLVEKFVRSVSWKN